jgi:hypothetical protein
MAATRETPIGDKRKRIWVAFKWCQKWDAVTRQLELVKKYQLVPDPIPHPKKEPRHDREAKRQRAILSHEI